MSRPLAAMPRPLAALLLAAAMLASVGCQSPAATSAGLAVVGRAVAGPTCPVQPASPIPGQCEPRAVAGAVLVVTDGSGREVARVTTAADGTFALMLTPGSYTLVPQPVTGLIGGARQLAFTAPPAPGQADLVVDYDTGIR